MNMKPINQAGEATARNKWEVARILGEEIAIIEWVSLGKSIDICILPDDEDSMQRANKIVRAVSLLEVLEETVALFVAADVPKLLRDSSDAHDKQFENSDPHSQFYGEDIVSRPLANKIESSLSKLSELKKSLNL